MRALVFLMGPRDEESSGAGKSFTEIASWGLASGRQGPTGLGSTTPSFGSESHQIPQSDNQRLERVHANFLTYS